MTEQKAEHAELAEKLISWMQEKIPAAENLQLIDFKAPEAGASNETILFTAKWMEQSLEKSQLYVVRMQPKGAGVFPSYDLALQYKAMDLLKNTEVKVPALLAYEEDDSLFGSAFYVMLGIDGQVVAEQPPYHMDGWFTEIKDQDRRDIWSNGIKTIASVNQQDWQALGFDFLANADQTPLQQQIGEYKSFLQWTEKKGQPYPALWALHAWLLENQPKDEPTALCWGDAKVANLLYKKNAVTAVLDWEMVHLGNPVDDLAWWMTLDNSMSEGLERLVGMEVPKQKGLLNKQEMIALWEQESGYSAADLDYYEVFGAFKFGIIMASICINMTNDGIVPPEMEMDINHTCTPLMDRLMEKHGIVL
ncbi:MAG: phosphotransferase family protein [Pseudomonadales bacterium]|nr:phosphotransferase family protein [Pseudomonadales bacterium]